MCQDCSFVRFNAYITYVHCIDGNDEEAEDNDDIVMYLNFWSMFCKPLLYRLCIQCHVTCYCCCFLCVSCTRLLIKSSSKSSSLCFFFCLFFFSAVSYFVDYAKFDLPLKLEPWSVVTWTLFLLMWLKSFWLEILTVYTETKYLSSDKHIRFKAFKAKRCNFLDRESWLCLNPNIRGWDRIIRSRNLNFVALIMYKVLWSL